MFSLRNMKKGQIIRSCLCHCKGTNFLANHNGPWVFLRLSAVVYATAKTAQHAVCLLSRGLHGPHLVIGLVELFLQTIERRPVASLGGRIFLLAEFLHFALQLVEPLLGLLGMEEDPGDINLCIISHNKDVC